MMKSALFFFVAAAVVSFASVPAEMEGMEVVSRGDGTFLVGGPTSYFDRILGAGGIHSESELWTPEKLRQRLLLNRMSIVPSWDVMEPSVWMKTGNEMGDMIYYDMIREGDQLDNRTPILEGGFRTPNFNGFWATARFFQDDFYAEDTRFFRRRFVSDEFAFFGENYPLFSTIYGGIGYTNDFMNASVLVGEEYLWQQGKSLFWIPVHYKPRIESRVDVKNLSVTVVYEDAEYENVRDHQMGSRKEVNGSVYYQCGDACKQGVFQVAAGLQFRAVDDSGYVYSKLEEDVVVLPFMQLRVQPLQNLTADVMLAVNGRDWLVQDSVEMNLPVAKQMNLNFGVKNISGTRLNPIGETAEILYGDTISLVADGHADLIQGYASFVDTIGNFSLELRGSFWMEYGAETFDPDGYETDQYGLTHFLYYRYGDVSRINEWIYGLTGELWLNAWYEDWFNFTAMAGFEHIDGPSREFEVTPAEFYTAFSADWFIRKSFKISHSVHYRSDARWNLVAPQAFVVKGDWYWDATFEQQFHKQGLFLTGSILHALGKERFEAPNANPGRVRFVCTVKKTF